MPYRAWLIAGLLGLTAALGQAQDEAGDAERRADNQGEPAERQEPPIPVIVTVPLAVEIIEDDAAAQARERSEAEAREREINDLAAQQGMNSATQSMNEATQDMRDYARIQTVLIGLGTALLIWTLWYTRQANRAAQDAVSVSRDIGKRQLRAYLLPLSCNNEMVDDDKAILLTVSLGNAGLTPAKNVRLSSMSIFGEYPWNDGPPVTIPEGIGGATIAPSGELMTAQRLWGSEAISVSDAIKLIQSGTHGAWIQGVAKYEDIFGEEHTTRFRFVWGGRLAGISRALHADTEGNYSD